MLQTWSHVFRPYTFKVFLYGKFKEVKISYYYWYYYVVSVVEFGLCELYDC